MHSSYYSLGYINVIDISCNECIIAEKHNITREESDAFSLRSQHLWGKAHEAGVFKNEIGE